MQNYNNIKLNHGGYYIFQKNIKNIQQYKLLTKYVENKVFEIKDIIEVKNDIPRPRIGSKVVPEYNKNFISIEYLVEEITKIINPEYFL